MKYNLATYTILGFLVLVSLGKGQENEFEADSIHADDLDALSDIDAYSYNQRNKAKEAVLKTLTLTNGDHVNYCDGELAPMGCEERVQALVNHMFSAARRYDIDPWLLIAVSLENTRLNPFHTSRTGASGVMGILHQRHWRRNNRFFTDRNYRNECKSEPDACQRDAIFHTASILKTSITECQNDQRLGIQSLASGRCRGNPQFARHVIRWVDSLLEIAATVEDVNVCEIHPLVCSDPLGGLYQEHD